MVKNGTQLFSRHVFFRQEPTCPECRGPLQLRRRHSSPVREGVKKMMVVLSTWAMKKRAPGCLGCIWDGIILPRYMRVSKNRGTPKWMVYNGKPYLNGWFGGTTILGNSHMGIFISHYKDPYKPTSISWKESEVFFFVAHLSNLNIFGAPGWLFIGYINMSFFCGIIWKNYI